jgi:hypothetical protein
VPTSYDAPVKRTELTAEQRAEWSRRVTLVDTLEHQIGEARKDRDGYAADRRADGVIPTDLSAAIDGKLSIAHIKRLIKDYNLEHGRPANDDD